MAGGTVLVSLDTFPGGATYAAIAAGREDAAIKSWLSEVARVKYHLPVIYVTFEHEADVPSHHGNWAHPPSSSRPGITSTSSLPPPT